MLTYLPSREDVIACRISGRMSAEEIEDISDKVLEAVERNETTHVYVETEGMTGFDAKAWAEQIKRGWPVFSKLSRFGRVAVVSDQQWIRWWLRIESAFLPGISYEVFDLAERERALAWVEGRIADPHESSFSILPTSDSRVIAFEITGRASAETMEAVVHEIMLRLEAVEGPVRVLGRFQRFRIPEPMGMFDTEFLKMKLTAFRKVERYATVGLPRWFRSTISLVSPLLRSEIRQFDEAEEAEAWDWLGAEMVAGQAREVAAETA
jgi:hypothetical protein